MSITGSRRLHDALLVLVLLFVADLFWARHRTRVDVAGVMSMHTGSSGWAGWGAAAGVFALTLGVLAAAVAVAVFLTEPEQRTSRTSKPPHGATP